MIMVRKTHPTFAIWAQWKFMKVIYDAEVNVLRILFSNAPIEESDDDKPGIIIDYNKDGNVMSIEILDASKRMDNPRAVDYAVMG
jgi:uncharacterized protein YuzE